MHSFKKFFWKVWQYNTSEKATALAKGLQLSHPSSPAAPSPNLERWAWVGSENQINVNTGWRKMPLEASACCWGPIFKYIPNYNRRDVRSLAVYITHATGPSVRPIQTWQKWKVWACLAGMYRTHRSTMYTRLTLQPFTTLSYKQEHAGLFINCCLDKCQGLMNGSVQWSKWKMGHWHGFLHLRPHLGPHLGGSSFTCTLQAISGSCAIKNFKTQEVLLTKGFGVVSRWLLNLKLYVGPWFRNPTEILPSLSLC